MEVFRAPGIHMRWIAVGILSSPHPAFASVLDRGPAETLQCEGTRWRPCSHELSMGRVRIHNCTEKREPSQPLIESLGHSLLRNWAAEGWLQALQGQHWLEKALLVPRLRIREIKGAKRVARRAQGQIPRVQVSLHGH